MIYNESTDRFNPDTMKEEHYTLTWEPEGKYLSIYLNFESHKTYSLTPNIASSVDYFMIYSHF